MSKLTLKKELNLIQVFSIGFGAVIGIAWLVATGLWVNTAGPLGAIIAFTIGGAAILVIALCYAKVAAAFPCSGGEIVWSHAAFGSATSYAVGWMMSLVYIAGCSFQALGVVWVLGTFVKSIDDSQVLYEVLGDKITVGALLILAVAQALITYINYRGAKLAANIQDIALAFCIGIALIFVVVGISYGSLENARPFIAMSANGSWWANIFTVVAITPAIYAGFNSLSQTLGEVKDQQTIRRFLYVILATVICTLLFYTFIAVATSMVATRAEMIQNKFYLLEALDRVTGTRIIGYALVVSGLLGILTTWNAAFLVATRVLFALSRARLLPSWFSKVHSDYGSPTNAVIFVGIAGGIAMLGGRNSLVPIMNIFSVVFSLAYLVTCLSLIKVRKKITDDHQKYGHNLLLGLLGSLLSSAFLITAFINIIHQENKGIAEISIILLWSLLGIVLWRRITPYRNSITERERGELVTMR